MAPSHLTRTSNKLSGYCGHFRSRCLQRTLLSLFFFTLGLSPSVWILYSDANYRELRFGNASLKPPLMSSATQTPRCRNITKGEIDDGRICETVQTAIQRLLHGRSEEQQLGVLHFAGSFACYVVTLTFDKRLKTGISQFFLYDVSAFRSTIRSRLITCLFVQG